VIVLAIHNDTVSLNAEHKLPWIPRTLITDHDSRRGTLSRATLSGDEGQISPKAAFQMMLKRVAELINPVINYTLGKAIEMRLILAPQRGSSQNTDTCVASSFLMRQKGCIENR
jgi:hypothetical protein